MTDDGWTMDELRAAHKASINNRSAIDESAKAGCFRCIYVFPVPRVKKWIDDGQTALCPWCGIDSVIPESSGFPATDRRFLKAMRERWFEAA